MELNRSVPRMLISTVTDARQRVPIHVKANFRMQKNDDQERAFFSNLEYNRIFRVVIKPNEFLL